MLAFCGKDVLFLQIEIIKKGDRIMNEWDVKR